MTPSDDELLLGNFIADSVKGDPYKQLPARVADGVKLHRAIDSFTDSHQLVKTGVNRLRPTQGRYASVAIDVLYDHVLASNWQDFHHQSLGHFVEQIYQKLEVQNHHFPENVKRYFPYMKQQNWLYNYQFEWGFRKSLEGLDRRTKTDTHLVTSIEVYKKNKAEFLEEFEVFISDAREMVSSHSS